MENIEAIETIERYFSYYRKETATLISVSE